MDFPITLKRDREWNERSRDSLSGFKIRAASGYMIVLRRSATRPWEGGRGTCSH
jgi:hypothetical protein